MKKTITLLTFLTLWISNSNAQLKLNDFDDAKIYFAGIFEDGSQIDEYGNITIDMGSASAGRLMLRISDVNIKMEERKEEPGCSDVCPPRILIHFECHKAACISDPASDFEPNQSGVIAFDDLKKGKKAYEYLIALKELIKNN